MHKEVKKVMVIGLDAPIVKSIEKYVKEGKLPVMAKLIENGTWAENCLVPHPTITPPNWTTIATGSWPGTHGITDFHIHKPGTDLKETYQAFSSEDCQSEYIWEAAEKVDKKTIIVNYPTSWPPRIKQGIQIAGGGLHVTRWLMDKNNKCLRWMDALYNISDEQLFSTEEYPFADIVKSKPAREWKDLPAGKSFLEAKIKVGYRNCRNKVEPQEWYILIQDSLGKGYDTISLAKNKDGKKIMFSIKQGEWSKKIYQEFMVEGEKKKAVFMAKLIELSSDAQKVRLYVTPFCQLDGWSYPEGIADELKDVDGLPAGFLQTPWLLEWFDLQTYLERIDLENVWLGEAVNKLLKNHSWDMFFMHAHCTDLAYHAFINKLDPSACKNKSELKIYQDAEMQIYQSLDRMIEKIVECADRDTLIMIVSDHGAVPTEGKFEKDFKEFYVERLLIEEGLTVFKKERPEDIAGWRKVEVDWSKNKGNWPKVSLYLY